MRHVSVQQLSAFLDGALAGVSRELVTRHLASCTGCRERHAGWRARDEALRRVLSWEPDGRTLEEWSSRVELTLTAERKGLPAPEFSALQHPVLAPAPEPDADKVREVVSHARPPVATSPPPEPAAEAPGEARVPGASAEIEEAAAALAHIALSVSARIHDPGPPADPSPQPRAERVAARPAAAPPRAEPRPGEHRRPRARRARRGLLASAALLIVALLVSPFLPEVIRIPVPERWLPRLPRVEFVRHGGAPESPAALPSPDAPASFTSRTPVVAELVPRAALSVPEDSLAVAAASPDGALPLPVRARSVAEASPEPSGRENPTTLVPVRVKTTVQLAPSPRRESAPATTPPVAPETDEDWPLLCGEVLDATGTPVEGARVVLVSPALTVRTDRRGRFCVACPAGVRNLRIEAEGYPPTTRTVELSVGMVETRITLAPSR